jgi:hypothetical protein
MMGTKLNMKRRERTQRIDDECRCHHVEQARALMFKQGASINSQHIQNILNEESLVPTWVSHSSQVIGF